MIYKILPSLLAADLTRLGEEVDAVMQAGADMVHFDVMDNHYVPNLTFGAPVCAALHQRFNRLPIDVHLMTRPVDDLILSFAKAGATRISIHPDSTIHLDRSLQLIKDQGLQAGIALNPAASPDSIEWCLHHLDFLLIMTVNPGFGGQTLIPEIIKKIAHLHHQYPQLPLCADGGITTENIKNLAIAGATEFVAGSSVFHSKSYASTITSLRKAAEYA